MTRTPLVVSGDGQHLTTWVVNESTVNIVARACHRLYKQRYAKYLEKDLSSAHPGHSTLFLDVAMYNLHCIRGALNDYAVVRGDSSGGPNGLQHNPDAPYVFQYNEEFFKKRLRLANFTDRAHAETFIRKMDFKLLCAAKGITDMVKDQDLFTEATGLYPTIHKGKTMPNHYYAKRSDGMEFALLYMSECTHKLLSMLTLDERKVFVENISVDFDNGEKPVAFGGSFLPGVDKQEQETHKSEPCNDTALTHTTQPKRSSSTPPCCGTRNRLVLSSRRRARKKGRAPAFVRTRTISSTKNSQNAAPGCDLSS